MNNFEKMVEILNKKNIDSDEQCKICKYKDGCPRDVICYGDSPAYPPCADDDILDLIDENYLYNYLIDMGYMNENYTEVE